MAAAAVPDWAKAKEEVPAWAAAPSSPDAAAAPPPGKKPPRERSIDIGGPAGIVTGVVENILQMGSGAIAKPVSDVAGLAAMGSDAVRGRKDGDPEGFKQEVQRAGTYQPQTTWGKRIAEANPLKYVGQGIDWVGSQFEAKPDAPTWQRMAGAGAHEAVNQLPSLAGVKGPAAGAAAGAALKTGARDLMQSALKPTIADLRKGNAGRAVDTMLDEGINVSRGGLEKVRGKVDDLNTHIADAVQSSKAVVDKRTVLMRLNRVFRDFENQVNPTSDIVAIQKAYDDFDKHPLLTSNKIPVQQAQTLKQGTYKSLGNKSYGELKGADIEAQKALARGLKEKIAQAVPEVRALNAEESKLLNTLPIIERRVLMDANKNPIGLGWLSTNPAKMAGFMADRSPLFKSLIARMLNQGSKAAPNVGNMAPLGGIATTQQAQMQPPPQQPQQP